MVSGAASGRAAFPFGRRARAFACREAFQLTITLALFGAFLLRISRCVIFIVVTRKCRALEATIRFAEVTFEVRGGVHCPLLCWKSFSGDNYGYPIGTFSGALPWGGRACPFGRLVQAWISLRFSDEICRGGSFTPAPRPGKGQKNQTFKLKHEIATVGGTS